MDEKAAKKLSAAQINMLRGVRDHGDPLMYVHGAAAHGGANGTRASLERRKLMRCDGQAWSLTSTGAKALAAVEKASGRN